MTFEQWLEEESPHYNTIETKEDVVRNLKLSWNAAITSAVDRVNAEWLIADLENIHYELYRDLTEGVASLLTDL